MRNEVKKPVVLLLAEGLGLSPRWQGNAIASAHPQNFERLWQSYYHLALLPYSRPEEKPAFFKNPKTSYWPVARGENFLPPADFVRESLTRSPAGLSPVFEAVKTKNGALHLIGTLSGEENDLQVVLCAAAASKLHRLYLHLLLDESSGNSAKIQHDLAKLEKIVKSSGQGEIVSMCGLNFSDTAPAEYQRLITKGEGARYIDPNQAVDDYSGSLQTLPPAYFTENPDSFIKDFDTVFFFDHTLAPLQQILTFLLQRGWGVKQPKFLDLWVFEYFPFAYAERLKFVFERPKPPSIALLLEQKNIPSLLLAEAAEGRELDYYLDAKSFRKEIYLQPSRFQDYAEQWPEILAKTEEVLCRQVAEKNYDLIVAVCSVLPQVCSEGRFGDCVKAVLGLDKLIGALEKTVLENGGSFVLASPFGSIEAVTQPGRVRSKVPLPTANPVPLIIVADNAKVGEYKQQSPKNLIDELVFSRRDLKVLHQFLRLIAGP